MGLLEKLKSLFGSGDERRPVSSPDEPEVTVEHEPAAESEHAVKGTEEPETAPTPGTDPEASGTEKPETEMETETETETGAEADSPSVEEIKGIGPTYSGRLAGAGIGTVADLAEADPETVAEAAETSPSRAEDWIERARNR
jgi:predicted flap endonuclease-1-like 5' DNA nuclease